MKELLATLAQITARFAVNEGRNNTPIPGVYCIKLPNVDRRTRRHWHACLAIVAQGCKEILLGTTVYRCDVGHYTATPIDLPVISKVATASNEKPFLSLLIELNPRVLSEVAKQISSQTIHEKNKPSQAMFVGVAENKMLEAAVRLGKLFDTPEDARVLGPLLIRELFYYLLKGNNGPAIHQFVRSGSNMHKIAQAIHMLQSQLSDEVDVEALAKAAHMSRSAFFRQFKEITAASPIQYQKRLRLLEAKRLMTEEGETAERSAYKVGYNSAPQFSREYSRMFGTAPKRDSAKHKKTWTKIYP